MGGGETANGGYFVWRNTQPVEKRFMRVRRCPFEFSVPLDHILVAETALSKQGDPHISGYNGWALPSQGMNQFAQNVLLALEIADVPLQSGQTVLQNMKP